MEEFNIAGIGARLGLKGKLGAMPTRSRRCNGELSYYIATGFFLGRRRYTMNLSQKNCLFYNHQLTCERWGGDLLYGQLYQWLIVISTVFSGGDFLFT